MLARGIYSFWKMTFAVLLDVKRFSVSPLKLNSDMKISSQPCIPTIGRWSRRR